MSLGSAGPISPRSLVASLLAVGLVSIGLAPVAGADHQDVVISLPGPPDSYNCWGTPEDNEQVGDAGRPGPNATVYVDDHAVVAAPGDDESTVSVSVPSFSAGIDGPVDEEIQTPAFERSSTTTVDPVSVGLCLD